MLLYILVVYARSFSPLGEEGELQFFFFVYQLDARCAFLYFLTSGSLPLYFFRLSWTLVFRISWSLLLPVDTDPSLLAFLSFITSGNHGPLISDILDLYYFRLSRPLISWHSWPLLQPYSSGWSALMDLTNKLAEHWRNIGYYFSAPLLWITSTPTPEVQRFHPTCNILISAPCQPNSPGLGSVACLLSRLQTTYCVRFG